MDHPMILVLLESVIHVTQVLCCDLASCFRHPDEYVISFGIIHEC